jgi:VIT1/CCC1 family predicted Fe2+/Mn2+ transporter
MLPRQFEEIRQALLKLPHHHVRPRITGKDWRGAIGVFLLVFLSTFPVVLPFLLGMNVHRALRVSNLVAIVMLALTGYSYGHYSGQRAWMWSLSMVLVGAAMVGLTIRLGG